MPPSWQTAPTSGFESSQAFIPEQTQPNMMNPKLSMIKAATLALSTAALVACGGGGGADPAPTPTPAPTPVPTVANAQGFWSATPSATTSVGAVILPNGQAWVIYQTGSTVTALAQGSLSLSGTTFTGVGKHYTLPAGAVQDFSLSAIAGSTTTTATTPTLINTTTVGTASSSTLTWTYNKTYETPATQASVQGRWSGLQGAVSD